MWYVCVRYGHWAKPQSQMFPFRQRSSPICPWRLTWIIFHSIFIHILIIGATPFPQSMLFHVEQASFFRCVVSEYLQVVGPWVVRSLEFAKCFVQTPGQNLQWPVRTTGLLCICEEHIDRMPVHDARGKLKLRPLFIFQRFWNSTLCESWESKLTLVHRIDYCTQYVALNFCPHFGLGIHLPVWENTSKMSHVTVSSSSMGIDVFGFSDCTLQLVANFALCMCWLMSKFYFCFPTWWLQDTEKCRSTCNRQLLCKTFSLIQSEEVWIGPRWQISSWQSWWIMVSNPQCRLQGMFHQSSK